jgi:hypothetical protein
MNQSLKFLTGHRWFASRRPNKITSSLTLGVKPPRGGFFVYRRAILLDFEEYHSPNWCTVFVPQPALSIKHDLPFIEKLLIRWPEMKIFTIQIDFIWWL